MNLVVLVDMTPLVGTAATSEEQLQYALRPLLPAWLRSLIQGRPDKRERTRRPIPLHGGRRAFIFARAAALPLCIVSDEARRTRRLVDGHCGGTNAGSVHCLPDGGRVSQGHERLIRR